ncbi:hypothetical protein [Streptomyces longisporoflavus]|uniref:Uncharacterized protein n=1 Tax=Streptomyces longisporoflavus TaxID=28044 RepID=A0ABW7R388_9ACTN
MAGEASAETLIVAALSLVMSAVTLSWQVASHLLAGARVRCELSLAIHDDSDPVPSIVATVADRKKTNLEGLQTEDSQIYVHDAFSIVVRNRGRSPVSVSSPYLSVGRGYWGASPLRVRYLGFQMIAGTCRLEPGEAKTWLVPMWDVIDSIRENHPERPVTCRAAVLLGTGRWVKARRANTWTVPAEMTQLRPNPPA